MRCPQTGEYIDEHRDTPLDRPVIASIAADPGQTYFVRTDATAVIVRSDKPDLQLAALNAGAVVPDRDRRTAGALVRA